jgi:hypothetical protein
MVHTLSVTLFFISQHLSFSVFARESLQPSRFRGVHHASVDGFFEAEKNLIHQGNVEYTKE